MSLNIFSKRPLARMLGSLPGNHSGMPEIIGNFSINPGELEGARQVMERMNISLNQKLAELSTRSLRRSHELPQRKYLPKRPFSAWFWMEVTGMAFVALESVSWINGASYVKDVLGDDHYLVALAVSFPIVVVPIVLEYFSDFFKKFRRQVNILLFAAFVVCAVGFFLQFADKFAIKVKDPVPFKFTLGAKDGAQAPTETTVSYHWFLGFQLLLEAMGGYVLTIYWRKFRGPQVDPNWQTVTDELADFAVEIQETERELMAVMFQIARLRAPTALSEINPATSAPARPPQNFDRPPGYYLSQIKPTDH